jgi:hypothetical protein
MVQPADTLSRETRIWRGFARGSLNEVDVSNQASACDSIVKIRQLSRLTVVLQDCKNQ